MDRMTFWGTGDAMGVPRVYCDCGICEGARAFGTNRRLRSSVWVEADEGRFLIDCGPDWREQMAAAGLRTLDDVLITHAHFDHIGGIPDLYDACRWAKRRARLHAPQEVLAIIERQFPWVRGCLDMIANDDGVELAGWRIRPWRVNHGKNGYAYAYRLEKNGHAWVYCSDAINLPPEQQAPFANLDLLVLGTSFYQEPYPMDTRSVYDVTEALELIAAWRPGRTLFTHLSHDIDTGLPRRFPDGVGFATVGMRVPLT